MKISYFYSEICYVSPPPPMGEGQGGGDNVIKFFLFFIPLTPPSPERGEGKVLFS
jgi:hypothetical protein